MPNVPTMIGSVLGVIFVLFILIMLMKSIHRIGPTEFGAVSKKFGKKLEDGQLIALNGEAGYQPDLLMPGVRFKLSLLYKVERHQLVQVPPGSIGLVIAQVGAPLPVGAKTATYKEALGLFGDVRAFLSEGGQQGVQRRVLPAGTVQAMHPLAFVVVSTGGMFGTPLSEGTSSLIDSIGPNDLRVVEIGTGRANGIGEVTRSLSKRERRDLEARGVDPSSYMAETMTGPASVGASVDMIGVVTVLDGPPLPSGDQAGRIGGFDDIKELEAADGDASDIIQVLLGNKNDLHNNYQDFQAFLDSGGCIGRQHDVLMPGAYMLNPFCVQVEQKPMLVVDQGEVAVVKAYLGLPTVDMSGDEYKFGSIVAPGHRGIWNLTLGTGKYGLNSHIYESLKVPTSILTLNWARATSEAHNLDARLSAIDAKSKDAFDFSIDLQVLIHVPDVKAPKVIGMVGDMANLVNEVLQAAVGNYFRNRLQSIKATQFIEERQAIQEEAEAYVKETLAVYDVEVRGVYIQDVVLPEELVKVLNDREIANQEKATYAAQQDAQQARIALEAQRGEADQQAELARAKVSVGIKEAEAEAAVKQAEGEASVIKLTGEAEAAKLQVVGEANGAAAKALGEGQAAGYAAQREAIGAGQTAAVAIVDALGKAGLPIVPHTLVQSGATGNGVLDLIFANLATDGTTNGAQLPAPSEPEGTGDQPPAELEQVSTPQELETRPEADAPDSPELDDEADR